MVQFDGVMQTNGDLLSNSFGRKTFQSCLIKPIDLKASGIFARRLERSHITYMRCLLWFECRPWHQQYHSDKHQHSSHTTAIFDVKPHPHIHKLHEYRSEIFFILFEYMELLFLCVLYRHSWFGLDALSVFLLAVSCVCIAKFTYGERKYFTNTLMRLVFSTCFHNKWRPFFHFSHSYEKCYWSQLITLLKLNCVSTHIYVITVHTHPTNMQKYQPGKLPNSVNLSLH